MEIIDKRPRIKTSIFEGQFVTILRENLVTLKIHKVRISSEVYREYLKSNRNKAILQKALLDKETIDFIHSNIIKGEPKPVFQYVNVPKVIA